MSERGDPPTRTADAGGWGVSPQFLSSTKKRGEVLVALELDRVPEPRHGNTRVVFPEQSTPLVTPLDKTRGTPYRGFQRVLAMGGEARFDETCEILIAVRKSRFPSRNTCREVVQEAAASVPDDRTDPLDIGVHRLLPLGRDTPFQ